MLLKGRKQYERVFLLCLIILYSYFVKNWNTRGLILNPVDDCHKMHMTRANSESISVMYSATCIIMKVDKDKLDWDAGCAIYISNIKSSKVLSYSIL